MICAIPWWNCYCEMAWQRKMLQWNNRDVIRFHHATSTDTVYTYISKEMADDLKQVWPSSAFKLASSVYCGEHDFIEAS